VSAEEDCLVEVWGGWTMVQRCNEVGKMLSVERCKTMDGFLLGQTWMARLVHGGIPWIGLCHFHTVTLGDVRGIAS